MVDDWRSRFTARKPRPLQGRRRGIEPGWETCRNRGFRRLRPPVAFRHRQAGWTSLALPDGTLTVQDVAFDPSGSQLIAATGKLVTIWNLRTHMRTVLRPREGFVWSVAFSPDGHHMAAGFEDNNARIWDLRNARDGGAQWSRRRRHARGLQP